MKPAVHDYADKLLDLAYGELQDSEATELETHVRGCTQCSAELDSIRGVRRTMSQLPPATEPDAGLESLLAYAEQSARRAAAGPAPSAGGWRKWLAPVLGFTAIAALAMVLLPIMNKHQAAPSASEAMAQLKVAEADVKTAPLMQPAPEPTVDESAELDRAKTAAVETVAKAEEKKEVATKDVAMGDTAALGKNDSPKGLAALDGLEAQQKPAKMSTNSADFRGGFAGNTNSTGNLGTKGMGAGGGGMGLGSVGGGKANSGPGRSAVGVGSGGYLGTPKQEPAEQGGEDFENSFGASTRDQTRAENKPADDEDAVALGGVADKLQEQPAAVTGSAYGKNEQQTRKLPAEEPPPPPAPMKKSKVAAKESSYKYDDSPAPVAQAPAMVETESAQEERMVVSDRKDAERSRADALHAQYESLSAAAWTARKSGDRQREAALLQQAVAMGISGTDLAGALNRLCETYGALGNYAAANAACERVIKEFPNSGASQIAARQLRLQNATPDAEGTGHASQKKAAPRELEKATDSAQ